MAVLRRAKNIANADEPAREVLLEDAERLENWCAVVVIVAVALEAIVNLPPLLGAAPFCDWVERAVGFFADAAIALGVFGELRFGNVASAVLKTQLGEAKVRAANADRKTAQILARISRRSLTEAQQQAIAVEISSFKGQRAYLVTAPSTNETEVTMRLIARALEIGGWSIVGTNSSDRPIFIEPPGVVVQWFAQDGSDPMTRPDVNAACALAEALRKAGIGASAIAGPMDSMGAITVVINTKE